MRIKITPLNVVSAIGLVMAALLLLNSNIFISPVNQSYTGLMVAISLLVVFMAFLVDQIFRKFVPSLYKIWVLQLVLIGLTIIFFFVLKAALFNG